MRLLLVSTPIGTLGSGSGGGIEFTITNVAQEMQRRGHQVTILAPDGSTLAGIEMITVPGKGQISVQNQYEDAPITLPVNSVLANLWQKAREIQHNYDAVVNYAYDWLPFYLTPFFQTILLHHVSMSFVTHSIDRALASIAQKYPERLKFGSFAQAQTFSFDTSYCPVIYHGLPVDQYNFSATPKKYLLWLGRIAPEKALEDGVRVAQMTGIPLRIFGKLEDREYWENIQQNFPDAPIEYGGFLDNKADLQQVIGESMALLMTARWVEAFGNVVIESLACGTPVITYDRGGPGEIITDGETGFVVKPDSVVALVEAVNRIAEIDRLCCRRVVEEKFSLEAMGDRLEQWLTSAIA
ncbi:glycosyltransferase family 4 protein [Waterburya agarophytonicola K14]|uniref:Glycosyltransferase family 4 protein n=1 Tax=Waterburya agarophytonicola KI4 TaxID=2874699 RepID=A0A964BSX3_9CYAN|nr:glycosyltransferase family 4 protein [Waterburya agarophytonicola]MCC0177646.1 glycosyltransferase family 4 protein [Waterburya agarophytonicola KI4]